VSGITPQIRGIPGIRGFVRDGITIGFPFGTIVTSSAIGRESQ
jgi:hypothetical protein